MTKRFLVQKKEKERDIKGSVGASILQYKARSHAQLESQTHTSNLAWLFLLRGGWHVFDILFCKKKKKVKMKDSLDKQHVIHLYSFL